MKCPAGNGAKTDLVRPDDIPARHFILQVSNHFYFNVWLTQLRLQSIIATTQRKVIGSQGK